MIINPEILQEFVESQLEPHEKPLEALLLVCYEDEEKESPQFTMAGAYPANNRVRAVMVEEAAKVVDNK